jgi:beta-glucosidase-like glycosyl hydrolase
LLNVMCKNPKERIKGLLKEVGIRDELLEKERNQELRRLLKLEKEKNEKLN